MKKHAEPSLSDVHIQTGLQLSDEDKEHIKRLREKREKAKALRDPVFEESIVKYWDDREPSSEETKLLHVMMASMESVLSAVMMAKMTLTDALDSIETMVDDTLQLVDGDAITLAVEQAELEAIRVIEGLVNTALSRNAEYTDLHYDTATPEDLNVLRIVKQLTESVLSQFISGRITIMDTLDALDGMVDDAYQNVSTDDAFKALDIINTEALTVLTNFVSRIDGMSNNDDEHYEEFAELRDVPIFTVGTHTDSAGVVRGYERKDLQFMLDAFNSKKLSSVPAKIGHTSDEFNERVATALDIPLALIAGEGPSSKGAIRIGEIASLSLDDSGTLSAHVALANEKVASLVSNGYFTAVSPELRITSEGPILGGLAFLGAQRPALPSNHNSLTNAVLLDDGLAPDAVYEFEASLSEYAEGDKSWLVRLRRKKDGKGIFTFVSAGNESEAKSKAITQGKKLLPGDIEAETAVQRSKGRQAFGAIAGAIAGAAVGGVAGQVAGGAVGTVGGAATIGAPKSPEQFLQTGGQIGRKGGRAIGGAIGSAVGAVKGFHRGRRFEDPEYGETYTIVDEDTGEELPLYEIDPSSFKEIRDVYSVPRARDDFRKPFGNEEAGSEVIFDIPIMDARTRQVKDVIHHRAPTSETAMRDVINALSQGLREFSVTFGRGAGVVAVTMLGSRFLLGKGVMRSKKLAGPSIKVDSEIDMVSKIKNLLTRSFNEGDLDVQFEEVSNRNDDIFEEYTMPYYAELKTKEELDAMSPEERKKYLDGKKAEAAKAEESKNGERHMDTRITTALHLKSGATYSEVLTAINEIQNKSTASFSESDFKDLQKQVRTSHYKELTQNLAVSGTPEELASKLVTYEERGGVELAEEILGEWNGITEKARDSGLFKAHLSTRPGESNAAFMEMVSKFAETNPTMTHADATAAVMRANPGAYREYAESMRTNDGNTG